MPQTALLVIDVQKGLFNRRIPVYRAVELLTNIGGLIDRAHRAGAPVFFVRQQTKGDLAPGSDGWQLHSDLRPADGDRFIDKRYASAFRETRLRLALKKLGVRTTVVAGLATHQCVKATCFDARRFGFDVVLAADAHSNFNRDAAALIARWNARLASDTARVMAAAAIRFP